MAFVDNAASAVDLDLPGSATSAADLDLGDGVSSDLDLGDGAAAGKHGRAGRRTSCHLPSPAPSTMTTRPRPPTSTSRAARPRPPTFSAATTRLPQQVSGRLVAERFFPPGATSSMAAEVVRLQSWLGASVQISDCAMLCSGTAPLSP